MIIAGLSADTVYGGAGHDTVLGDNGLIRLISGNLEFIQSTEKYEGASDTLRGEGGDDILVGGADSDQINGGSEQDLIFGDNVTLDRSVGDGLANARYRTLTGGQIYSTDGTVLVSPNSGSVPGGAAFWEVLAITFLDHDEATESAGSTNFGDDYIAGGAHNDQIFGQLGNDTIQGDGSIDLTVGAQRLQDGTLSVLPSVENAATDGDDYIEGNGGNDIIFGNLGQDDIIGGSSSLFSLNDPDQRTDATGEDLLFGGAGTDLARNHVGDTTNNKHAADSDMILGDNGNIYRLMGASGQLLQFSYDQTVSGYEDRGALRIVVRAAELLDYTEGGVDQAKQLDPAVTELNDIGAADEIHGESGDDFIYGMVGNDLLFGEGQDDDIIGGTGHDWISAGTGDDGVLGDDGRILTSRNTYKSGNNDTALAEPLYGIAKVNATGTSGVDSQSISSPGNMQTAVINVEYQLKKTAMLTPFNLNYTPEYEPTETLSNDIIFGGWGNDALHGEIGSDAISGAEALSEFYSKPFNPGDILAFNLQTGEFSDYDEFNPLTRITYPDGSNFILNFDAFDAGAPLDTHAASGRVQTDGDDAIFGDLGNDWLVGGTGRDNMFGGFGSDLLNADDNLDTANANTTTDTHASYEDRAYGGAGRDVLIANTGGDRLIDWAGEFNSYLVPFAAFGAATVSRAVQPGIAAFLYALSASVGADLIGPAAVSGGPDARNNEPYGELGLVLQQDPYWHGQTGAPDDPQPGNIPGGARDVLRSATFNNGTADGFAADSGAWTVQNGRLEVAPTTLGGDAVSVFYVDAQRPLYFEVKATINAAKPTAGYKSNSYIIFDYQSPTDFKFSGVDISINKMVMGHRDATGWHIDVQVPAKLKPDQDYNVLLAVNGTIATVVINNSVNMSYAYQPRVVDGYSFGLNTGMIGIGADNAMARIDNVTAQVLPPKITLDHENDFSAGLGDPFSWTNSGDWQVSNGHYTGLPTDGDSFALSTFSLNLATSSYLKLDTAVDAQTFGGLIFDYYNENQFKFAAIIPGTDQVVIGHRTKKGWFIDATVTKPLNSGTTYELGVSLKGTTASVTLNGQSVVGFVFNASVVDGQAGLFSRNGSSSFDSIRIQTDDPQFKSNQQ